jgi:hypothetical protein
VKSAPPILLVRVELEELPVSIILASSAEDEARLHAWLSGPLARRHVLRAVEDALDDLTGGRRAA